jgi:hypothetical protein
MSAEATWAEGARRLTLVLEAANAEARRSSFQITPQRICRWHRAIFLTTFPVDAGRVREDHEPVQFAVPIEVGGDIRDIAQRGVLGHAAILASVEAACAAFNERVIELRRRERVASAREGARRRPSFTPRS